MAASGLCQFFFINSKVVIHECYINEWFNDPNRVNAKHEQGRDKLCTYKLLKHILDTECYLLKVTDRCCIWDLARFRCGVAPLATETGNLIILHLSLFHLSTICVFSVILMKSRRTNMY